MSDNNPPLQLPSGWISAVLGDLVTFEYGKGLIKEKRSNSGKIPVYGSSGVVGYHSTSLIQEKSIVIGRKGAIGSVYLVEKPSWPIDTTYFIIPSKELNIRYLFYLLKTMQLYRLDKSTAIPGLNRNDAYKMTVPIAPFNEQVRIVTKIEDLFSFLDAGTESLRKVQGQLKRYRQAVLKYAFEGKLTEEWRKTHKDLMETAQDLLRKIEKSNRDSSQTNGLTLFKNNLLHKVPDTWAWSNLGQFLTHSLLGIVVPGPLQNKEEEGVPYVKMNNITSDGYLDLSNLVYVKVNESDLNKYRLEKADILFNTRNSFELVGKTSIVKIVEKGMVFNNNIMRIRLAEGINPFFVAYQMNSPSFRNLMIREKKATTNICAIYAKDLMPLPIAIAPQKEQERIVEVIDFYISIINKTEWNIALEFKQIEKLRQSILKNAFEGNIVAQDPSDEPAEMLLRRIKEQKSDVTKKNSWRLSNYVK